MSGAQLQCPSCRATLAVIERDELATRQIWPFVTDADAIPHTPDHIGECATMATALVGTCAECVTSYWLLEYLVFPGSADALYEYLALTEVPSGPLAVIAAPEFDGVPWLTWTKQLTAGNTHCHQLGPLPIPEGTTPFGRNGVSACGGAPFWSHARETALRAWPRVAGQGATYVNSHSGCECRPQHR